MIGSCIDQVTCSLFYETFSLHPGSLSGSCAPLSGNFVSLSLGLWVDPMRSLRSPALFFLGNCARRKSRDGRDGTLAQLLQ